MTSKDKRKAKGETRRNTRATGVKLTDKGERDPIMTKLASIIEPMKEAFFVCRLHPKEYADECAARRAEEIKEEAEERRGGEEEGRGPEGGGVVWQYGSECSEGEHLPRWRKVDEEGGNYWLKLLVRRILAPKSIDKDAMDVEANAEKVTVKKEDEEDEEEEKPKKKKSKKRGRHRVTSRYTSQLSLYSQGGKRSPRSGGRGRGGRKSTPVKKEEEEEEQEEESRRRRKPLTRRRLLPRARRARRRRRG